MKIKKILISYWLTLVFIVVFLLRLPSLFEPFVYGDEGIYLTLGLAARKGLTFYSQIHDNKPPMLYLLAALTGNFTWYRALFFGWSLVTVYAFFQLARTVFPKNKKVIALITFVFAILTNLRTFEGNIANAENFMMLPTIVGIYLILKGLDERRLRDIRTAKVAWRLFVSRADLHRYFIAGMMFSLATLFKVPAVFDFLAVLAFLGFVILNSCLVRNRKRKILKLIQDDVPSVLLFIFGFVFPILLTFVYYFTQGAFSQYLTAAFLQNLPYLSSWDTGSHTQFSLFQSGVFIRGILLLVGCCFLLIKSSNLSRKFLLIFLWFLFSLFAALLSGRPYPHYLIQVLPSLSLLLGFLIPGIRKERLLALVAFSLFALSFWFYKFWGYANVSYYVNFYQYAFGQKSKERYFDDFDAKANDVYEAAEFIVSHTLPNEKIFIWGNEPYLYAISRRIPPGRYTVAYHVSDFNGWQETIEAIEREEVNLIMTTSENNYDFSALRGLLAAKYVKIATVGREFNFYQRL